MTETLRGRPWEDLDTRPAPESPEKAARVLKLAKDAEDRARRAALKAGTKQHRFEKGCGAR